MKTIDDVFGVLSKIEEHLRSNNGGNNGGNSTYSYSPSASNNESIEEKRERELKYQDMLDARLNGRYLEALRHERELHQTKQEHLQKEFDNEKEGLDKLKKYKDKSIEELEKKLKRKGLSDKTKEDILEAIGHLKRMDEIQHQMTIDEREFARSQHGKNKFTELSKTVSEFSDKMVKAYKSIRDFVEPWAKADDAASKFTKTLGGTKAAMDRLRKDTLDCVATGIGVKFNMSTEELLKAQQDYLKGVGRNINIDDNSRESMAAIARISQDAGVDGLGFAAQLENFGISMDKTGDHMGKMFAEASKSGISFQKYSDNVVKNIKLAQNYTFKNGIKGLESMAKKAAALKIDMQQVANLADKVSTVEGALETSAKLQVLGGPFASMSDPMGMLYEGLHDMEGLQDRIIKMVGGLGNFNKQTGEVEVSAFNKQRIKAAAAAMGMDYSQLMESVNAQAKRGEIEKQIKSSAVASKFDGDMKELIMNTGVIKDGKVGVNVNGKFKTLDEIKEGDRDILQQQTQSESEDIKQIAMDLRSLVDKEQGLKKQADAIQAEIASPFGQLLKWVHGIFDVAWVAVGILGAIKAAQAIGSIGNSASNMSDMFDMFRGGKGGIFRRGLGRAGKRGLIKTFGRKGATKILGRGAASAASRGVVSAGASGAASSAARGLGTKVLAAGAKGGGIGAVAGIAGAVGDYYTDKAVAEGKMEAGGTGHHLAKAGSKALEWGGIGATTGAAVLSFIPGIGTAAGALIGGAIGAIGGAISGAVSASKAKNEKIVDNQLKDLGIERKGDYGRGKLKKIDKALQTGELSDRMRRKLIQKGDIDIVKAIDKKKEEKEAKELKKEEIKAQSRKMNIRNAIINIGHANFSKRGFGLSKINPLDFSIPGILIKGVKETGFGKKIAAFDKSKSKASEEQNNNNSLRDFNININGSLKLTGDNGQSVDIISELRNNPQMLRSLADMISRELELQTRGGNFDKF